MDIQNYKIEDIKPYPKNAKKHDAKQIKQVAKSIEEFGFNQPIVVDKSGVIIKGHGRREAAMRLGMSRVPVIVQDLTEHEAMAARIADDKVAESEWDNDFLKFEIGTLSRADFDLGLTGFKTIS